MPFALRIRLNCKKRVFIFPGPWPFAWPLALVLAPGPGPQFVFTSPGPQFVFTGSGFKSLFTRLGQSQAWSCRYQPCPSNLYLLALAYDFYYRALNLHLPSYL